MHSDDELFERNVIKKIVKIFDEKNVDIVFSNLFIQKNDKNKILRRWVLKSKNGIQSNQSMINKKIQNGWMPPHTTLFIKKI